MRRSSTDTSRTVTFRSNGTTDTFTSKETTQTYAGNVTWQAAEPVRLRFSVQDRPYTQEGRLPLPNGTSNPATAFRALGLETEQPDDQHEFRLGRFEQDLLQRQGQLSASTTPLTSAFPTRIRYIFTRLEQPLRNPRRFDQGRRLQQLLTNRARSKDLYTRIGASADRHLLRQRRRASTRSRAASSSSASPTMSPTSNNSRTSPSAGTSH